MTCPHCTTPDPRRLCCAAHKIERATRDDEGTFLLQIASKHGHNPDDLRAGIAEIRRERRKAAGEVAR